MHGLKQQVIVQLNVLATPEQQTSLVLLCIVCNVAKVVYIQILHIVPKGVENGLREPWQTCNWCFLALESTGKLCSMFK